MNGGLHIYFNYDNSDPETDYLIKTFLKTSTKYRGKGLDIRTDGGIVVMPGSIIDDKEYKIISNTIAINDMPHNLVEWLLEPYTTDDTSATATIEPVMKKKD